MKNSRIDLRITVAEKDIWQSHADRIGLTLTELITRSVRQNIPNSNMTTTTTGFAPSGPPTIYPSTGVNA